MGAAQCEQGKSFVDALTAADSAMGERAKPFTTKLSLSCHASAAKAMACV
jgi:hypothetical protein